MNVADGLGDLTGQLARLYAAPAPTTRTDLDVDAALHGRSAVIALCRELHFWGSRVRVGRAPGIVDLETNPASGLAWQLNHHPQPEASRSPMDVARAAAPGSAADRWERLATQATLVLTRWDAAEKPMGPQVQTVLADVAVVALSISHLDERLARSAKASGRPDVTAALTSRAVHGLRHSAEATLRHLARGDLPAWRAMVAPDHGRLPVLPMRNPADTPRGLARLMSLLDAGTHVSPQHLRHVLRSQERIASTLVKQCASLWRATADPTALETGRCLQEVRQALGDTAPALARDIGSLDPGDPRPVLQVNECLRSLGFSLPESLNGLQQRVDLVADQAQTLLYSVEATGTCVRDQVKRSRWIANDWDRHETHQSWSAITDVAHARIAPVVTLGETAMDLLTRPKPLTAMASAQPPMTATVTRSHAPA